ncbi:unnamed protein product, partial [Discosporangium mesarthrocarpum]
ERGQGIGPGQGSGTSISAVALSTTVNCGVTRLLLGEVALGLVRWMGQNTGAWALAGEPGGWEEDIVAAAAITATLGAWWHRGRGSPKTARSNGVSDLFEGKNSETEQNTGGIHGVPGPAGASDMRLGGGFSELGATGTMGKNYGPGVSRGAFRGGYDDLTCLVETLDLLLPAVASAVGVGWATALRQVTLAETVSLLPESEG